VNNWIDFNEKKPDRLIIAIVCNIKGWMSYILATYHPIDDVWVLVDPNYRHSIVLEVTHYIELPRLPEESGCL
jgi:hypothetical protein